MGERKLVQHFCERTYVFIVARDGTIYRDALRIFVMASRDSTLERDALQRREVCWSIHFVQLFVMMKTQFFSFFYYLTLNIYDSGNFINSQFNVLGIITSLFLNKVNYF